MPDRTITNVHAIGGNARAIGHSLGASEDLEHVIVICHWNDNTVTTGWSKGIKVSDLVYSAKVLDMDVEELMQSLKA